MIRRSSCDDVREGGKRLSSDEVDEDDKIIKFSVTERCSKD